MPRTLLDFMSFDVVPFSVETSQFSEWFVSPPSPFAVAPLGDLLVLVNMRARARYPPLQYLVTKRWGRVDFVFVHHIMAKSMDGIEGVHRCRLGKNSRNRPRSRWNDGAHPRFHRHPASPWASMVGGEFKFFARTPMVFVVDDDINVLTTLEDPCCQAARERR